MRLLSPLIIWLVKVCVKRGLAGRKVAWIALAGIGALLRYLLESDQRQRTMLAVKPGERYDISVTKHLANRKLRGAK